MARLVGICRDEDSENFKKHQLPVYVDDMRTMIVEFDDPCRGFDPSHTAVSSHTSFKQFRQKFDSLKPDELVNALSVDCEQFNGLLSQLVVCVGCRRSVEKLYMDLASMGHLAVHPLVINRNAMLTVHHSVLLEPKSLHKLLIADSGKVRSVLNCLTKCRKNKRCSLHSLDMHVCKTKVSWEELWGVMSEDCRDECCVVESESLLDMLETYLQKHKFCSECRTKVMKAFNLLIGEGDHSQEKGYNPALYQGLRYCPTEQHLHLQPSAAYLNMLIDRAEPELLGSVRERHAKTLDVAQGEVLTCLGLYMYDRLHRLAMALKTLQMTFQLLYCTGIIALHTSFQETLQSKRGLSDSLEKLCAELQVSAANPMQQKNGKITNGNNGSKKTKKKSPKNHPLNENKDVLEKTLVDDQCQNCNRRKSRINLTPSHSPLRSTVIARTKQTRSLSPRSCNCLPDTTTVHCCGGGDTNAGIASANGGVVVANAQIINRVSSFDDDSLCNDAKPNTAHDSHDAGYCSQELSPDGGSPHNDKQKHLSRKLVGAVRSTSCCDSDTLEELPRSLCCGGDALMKLNKTFNHSTSSFNDYDGGCVCTLMDMLESDESDESNTGADDQSISPEEIEWFQQNHSLVSEERRVLRERLLRQFADMQARLTAVQRNEETV